MENNKMYFFISIPIALVFWLILNMMFSAPYLETIPKGIGLDEMLNSSIFLVFLVLAVLELLLIWKWVIPTAKKSKQYLLAYVMPEVELVLGFVVAFVMGSITPYYYFSLFWIVGMALVYREVYTIE
jgi:hypothetical protein